MDSLSVVTEASNYYLLILFKSLFELDFKSIPIEDETVFAHCEHQQLRALGVPIDVDLFDLEVLRVRFIGEFQSCDQLRSLLDMVVEVPKSQLIW